jgi:ABC-type multidrug transport system ATPase subunit
MGGHWATILRGVTGECRAARLTACMGPSGAGKSTLLKILACAITGGAREGDLLANGKRGERERERERRT